MPGPVPAAVGDAAVTKAVQGRRQNHAQTVTTRCGPGWDWAAQGEIREGFLEERAPELQTGD